jgi:DNA-binding CsgD family transcriptional regulator
VTQSAAGSSLELVESAYDLEAPASAWLSAVLVLNAGLATPTVLDDAMHERWQQVCVHVTAAHRLRRALATGQGQGEATIDAATMKVADATGLARETTARDRLRHAAMELQRTRERGDDPDTALAMWKGLVDGRWSLVDWFDTDGRRFIIARRNEPDVRDPRGLSPRERHVVAYTVLGESNKLIAYRLGLSEPTISATLADAMRKLGVASRTQLVQMLAVEPLTVEVQPLGGGGGPKPTSAIAISPL